ncbi:hypothetical protein KPH14_005334 [Odynerus spinipes]|uniref:tRNA/rRNA methyltransferase SpoU type domain-containing protein n=1 Tax=Odynerus spinipes TaxID=1348599 RepID=A0AAD9RBG7_9HYME|nr:hypothetical protein KPH14_005334 [Odynerus spinipes]
MDLHKKYMQYPTNNISILEVIDTTFKDDPFELLHRLVRSYNNEVVKNSLDVKKLQTFHTVLCYEYQLRFQSSNVHTYINLEDLCFQDIENILFPQKQWRSMSEVLILYDILLLQMVLYSDMQSIRIRLEQFRKSRHLNIVNSIETRELYMKGLECFLESLYLQCYLFNDEKQKGHEEFILLYLEDIKYFIITKDDIQWRALTSIILKLNCTFKKKNIIFPIWNLFLNELKDLKDLLAALSILADHCFSLSKDSGYDLYHDLYCGDRFWLLISEGLQSSVQQYRKWALFLMKKAVYFMSETGFENSGIKKNILTPFVCSASSQNMNDIKQKFCLVLEALEEKQNHLILPALTHVPRLIKSNKDHKMCGDCFNIVWLHCIFKRMLQHENNNIVRQGLLNVCNMDVAIYDEQFFEFLANILNNTFLYELEVDRNESEIIKRLTTLFTRIAKYEDKFISKFIFYISQIKWGPVAIFYVTHIIYVVSKEVQQNNALGYNEFNAIKLLISLNLNMHSLILRIASQINIIKTLSCFLCPINDLIQLANILSVFPSEEALRRGSNPWNIIVEWLPKVVTHKTATDFICHISEKYVLEDQKFEINIKTFSLMFFLLYDANIIFCCKPCPAAKAINTWLSLLIGSDMRPYSNIHMNINVLELMSYLLQFSLMGNCNSIIEMLTSYGDVAMKVIAKNLRKATNTLCYDDLDKFLNIITIFFNNQDLLFSKKEICKYAEELQKQSICLFENTSPIQGTQCLTALHILNFCQSMNLASCPKEIYEFCIINMQKFQIPDNESYDAENVKGKLMSHCYILITKLMHNYIQQFPVKLWKVDWYQIILNLLQLEGRDIIPTIAVVLKSIIEKNGIKTSQDIEHLKSTVQLCWRITFLHKKDNIFSVAVQNLVAVIVNSKFLNLPDTSNFINPFLTQLIQESENIPNLKRILLAQLELLHVNDLMNFQTSLLACLLHGYVSRRDKKIENQAYLYIKENLKESCTHLSIIDHNIDATVRAQAVILLHKIITTKRENAQIFLHSVLAELEKSKNKRYFKDSHLHRVKHRLMQILLILEPVLDMENLTLIQEVLCNYILEESNQHSIRLMQEWLLIRIFVRCENLHSKLWNFFEESLLKRPGCTSSVASIMYHVALLLSGTTQYNFLTEAMPYIACCCLGQNYNMRLYNQVIVVKLYELLRSSNFHCIVSEYMRLYNAALKSLQQGSLVKNSIKVQDDFYFSAFHPIDDYSLQTIYFELPRLSTMDADECIAPDLFQALNFKDNVNHPLCLYNLSEKLSKSKMYMHLVKSTPSNKEPLNCNEVDDNGLTDIQKKIIPTKSVISTPNDITSLQSSISQNNIMDDGIIIVASLIDRPANLGGLARTCEIFGVKELVIGNLQYTKDREFQNLSVSSDKWINITEVKPYQLCEYLLEKKDMGWDLMGAEQTANSTNILNMKFKKKTILVLGNEKNGIPANVIPLFDICVEIPQVGFTRSLNVHVTGAICIWQYAKQHIFV